MHGSTGSALGVPLERTDEALDLLLSVTHERGPFAGVYGLRYVKQSRALLGFTRFGTTCVFDLDGVDSKRTRTFFERALRENPEHALAMFGLARVEKLVKNHDKYIEWLNKARQADPRNPEIHAAWKKSQ